MAPTGITFVRYSEEDGLAQLRGFVFGGFQAGTRAPRGVNPELVSKFIKEEIHPDSATDAYMKVVCLLRFYEREDCLDAIRGALTGREQDSEDVMRSAYAIQAIAEAGERRAADEGAKYFDAKLVPHPKALDALPVMIETLVVLAPSGSPDKLVERIDQEVRLRKRREGESEESMAAYDQIAAVQRLQLPQALRLMKAKKDLLALPVDKRRSELIELYLGRSPNSTDLMMTWAGRLLRSEAMEGNGGPICAAFAAEMAKVDPEKVGKDPQTDVTVARCVQAVVYLGGILTSQERQLYQKVKLAGASFLWDDYPPLVDGSH